MSLIKLTHTYVRIGAQNGEYEFWSKPIPLIESSCKQWFPHQWYFSYWILFSIIGEINFTTNLFYIWLRLRVNQNQIIQLLCLRPIGRRHYAMLLSDVCLSRITGLSREQRGLGRLKLAEVAHVTRDSDLAFKVNRSKVNLLLMS